VVVVAVSVEATTVSMRRGRDKDHCKSLLQEPKHLLLRVKESEHVLCVKQVVHGLAHHPVWMQWFDLGWAVRERRCGTRRSCALASLAFDTLCCSTVQ